MCAVARALDVLGERWTLLVVRELLLGPKRFKDILAKLPAMGANRLADRLKKLQVAGVAARRTLPPPAGVHVYELTESGQRLRPAIYCLGAWGWELPLGDDLDHDSARAELIALGLTGTCAPELSAGLAETYEFHVGAERFHVSAIDGELLTLSGPAPGGADLLVQCDLDTFVALATGALTSTQALRRGQASIVEGDRDLLTRAFRLLSFSHSATDFRLVPLARAKRRPSARATSASSRGAVA